jgi:hypothetical protein
LPTIDEDALPEDLTPLNIQAYFYHALGACGCGELDEMIDSVRRLLEWAGTDMSDRAEYNTLYSEVGVYYLLVGRLDVLLLLEHGTSIRYPWLTKRGKRLLAALQTTPTEEILEASGTAYNGIDY